MTAPKSDDPAVRIYRPAAQPPQPAAQQPAKPAVREIGGRRDGTDPTG